MKKPIIPFRSGGPDSKSWQIVIPAPIVKKYHIDESTCFIVNHNNNGIILSYASIEYKNRSVDLGLENFSQPITSIARGED